MAKNCTCQHSKEKTNNKTEIVGSKSGKKPAKDVEKSRKYIIDNTKNRK